MTKLTRSRLATLGSYSAENCFTFTIPTSRNKPEDYDKGRIHLKNLVTEAEQLLGKAGWSPPQIEEIFDPLTRLLVDSNFWGHQEQALVIYHSHDLSEHFRLPYELNGADVNHSQRFNIRPLLPYFRKDGRFYILKLSQNEVALYEATRYAINRIQTSDIPGSIDEALAYDDPERHTHSHLQGGATVYHGHHPKDESMSNLERFVNLVDKGVCNAIGASNAPLILAAVESYRPIYANTTNYPHLVDASVAGNFDGVSAEQLLAQTWPVLSPHLEQEKVGALEQYRNQQNTEFTSADLPTIVAAAHYGQVDTLFLPPDRYEYGTFDPSTGRTTMTDDGMELLDLAATQTLLQGGTVYHADELGALLRSPVAVG